MFMWTVDFCCILTCEMLPFWLFKYRWDSSNSLIWECIASHCLVMCSILVNVQKCFLFKRFSTLNAEEGTHLVPRSNVNWSNIKSRQFLNLSLSTVQFEEPLSEKRAFQPQRLLSNPLQWIKKEPLRLKGASEVHHSRQNHPLKKVAPWVCTVGSRVRGGVNPVVQPDRIKTRFCFWGLPLKT